MCIKLQPKIFIFYINVNNASKLHNLHREANLLDKMTQPNVQYKGTVKEYITYYLAVNFYLPYGPHFPYS